MPLARMMARSEAIQEHASGNPGLQTFLDKKGDEHVFSLLYLAAGIFCLYASYVHGAGFCVAPSVALQVGAASIAPPAMGRRLLDDPSNYLTGIFGGQDTHASTTGAAQLKTIPVSTAGKGPMLQEGAGGDNATETGEPAGEESVEGEVEGAVYDGKYWAGADLWVVRWLTVEGFTAVGLPFVSVVMLLLGMHENAGVSCVLYLVAIFQAMWLIVGCVWAFGGVVPPACRDEFAFTVMWWVCAIWLGSMVTISMVICCIICCFMGAAASASSSTDRKEYSKVDPNGAKAAAAEKV